MPPKRLLRRPLIAVALVMLAAAATSTVFASDGPATRVEALRAGCDADMLPHCAQLSRKLAIGSGVAPDLAGGIEVGTKACKGGHLGACAWLITLSEVGAPEPEALRQGALAEIAGKCERNNGPACSWLTTYGALHPEHLPKGKTAAKYSARACDLGEVYACFSLGVQQSKSKRKTERATARKTLEKTCKAGHTLSCGALAELLRKGIGGDKDEAAATLVIEEACDAGLVSLCAMLPDEMSRLGRGCGFEYMAHCDRLGLKELATETPEGALAATDLWRYSCANRHAPSCHKLASSHDSGKGVPKDAARARELWGQACRMGNPVSCEAAAAIERDVGKQERANAIAGVGCEYDHASSCGTLGLAYLLGLGLGEDKETAHLLFRLSCRSGDLQTCRTIGQAFATGEGVDKDEVLGKDLLARACKSGDEESCKELGAESPKKD